MSAHTSWRPTCPSGRHLQQAPGRSASRRQRRNQHVLVNVVAPDSLADTQAAKWSNSHLTDWLVSRGGKVNGLQLVASKHGRALVATKDHAAGELVISTPRDCQLRYDDVEDPRLLSLFERVPRGSDSGNAAWQYKQALTLLYHQCRGKDSPLHDYLLFLPGAPCAGGVDVPHVGMRLEAGVVEDLQDPLLQQDIYNHQYWLPHFHEREIAKLHKYPDSPFGSQRISLEAFGSAVAVVISRCFGLRATSTHTMPAVIDMADHSLEPNCEVVTDSSTGAVNLITKKPVSTGETMCVSYGPHSNADLVLSYGFAMANNPNDRYRWIWDLDVVLDIIETLGSVDRPTRPVPTWQQSALHKLGLPTTKSTEQDEPSRNVVLHVGGSPPVDGRLLGALRVLMAPPHLRAWVETQTPAGLCDWTTPSPLEAAVLSGLSRVCVAIYQSFPSTIQQDRKVQDALTLLDRGGEGSEEEKRQRRQLSIAIAHRLSLKRALERALQSILERGEGLEKEGPLSTR